jgi:hypothetical protein
MRYNRRIPEKVVGIYRKNATRIEVSDLDAEGYPDILATYARSSISRGINLPMYKTVLISGAPFKPTTATLAAEPTEAGYADALMDELYTKIGQPIGRIFRLEPDEITARRLVILHNLPRDDQGQIVMPENLTKSLQERVETPIPVLRSTDYADTLSAVKRWSDGGELAPNPESRRPDELSANQRAKRQDQIEAAKQNRKEARGEQARRRAIERLQAARADGKSWREAYRKANLGRYFTQEERAALKRQHG